MASMVTNCMELRTTWESLSILWNLQDHYCNDKRSSLDPILSHTNPVHTWYPILILSTSLHFGLLVVSFPLAFSPVTYTHSSSSHLGYIPQLSYPPRLNHSNYTSQRVQIIKLLIMQFSTPSRHIIPPWYKYFPQHPVLKCPQSVLLP
jgi:hypothetical protein